MFDTYNPPKGSFVIRLHDNGEVEIWPFVVAVEIDPLSGCAMARTLGGTVPLDAWCASDDREATADRDNLHALVIPHTEGPPPGAPSAAYSFGHSVFDGKSFVHSPTANSDRDIACLRLWIWAKRALKDWTTRNSVPEPNLRFPSWFLKAMDATELKPA